MADETNTSSGGRRRVVDGSQTEAEADRLAAEKAEADRLAAVSGEEVVDVFSAPKSGPVLMKAPDNCGSVTLDGEEYVPDAESSLVEIPARFVETMRSHGFEVP